MKKGLRIVLLVLAGALALAGAAAGLSRVMWGRSLQASLYEAVLRRRFATDRTAKTEVERLEQLKARGEKPSAPPEGLAFACPPRESAFQGMQVFTLKGAEAGPLVLYLHGGAYINGFNAYQWRFMDRLAREAGCEVVAPAYHLAPHADWRRAYADLTALYRHLLEAHPGRRLVLMGDSAGGGLALGLAEQWTRAGLALPERLILFSPWVDVSMENPDIPAYVAAEPILHLELVKVHGRAWANGADLRDPRVSPLFGDMAGLPPVDLYMGTRELLTPDLLLCRDALASAGVSVTLKVGRGLNHDWPLMPIPEARRAMKEILAAVEGTAKTGQG